MNLTHILFSGLLLSGVALSNQPLIGPDGRNKAAAAFTIRPGDSLVDRRAAQRQGAFAPVPPMGWNSYNCYGSAVTEKEVRANALYMARNLKSHGWNYIVVDYCWSYPNPPGSRHNTPPQFRLKDDGAYVPWLAMDSYGRLLPDARKYPSSAGGKGFAPLAAYVHSLGLKFGIHVMRGIPRQAVWGHYKVLGSTQTAADVADTSSTCEWLNHMYGLDMTKVASQQYLNSLLKLYASWGVDFIKVDDLSRPYHGPEVKGYEKAIESCGRAVAFSTSPGNTPLSEAGHVGSYANQWRMAEDFWDDWKALKNMFDLCDKWYPSIKPGHYPDCDMLTLGKLSRRGPVGHERFSNFTPDEQRTHMTLWCIFRSPLMMGGDLPENTPLVTELMTNDLALAMNQKGTAVRPVFHAADLAAWTSKTTGEKGVNLALFNLSDREQEVSVKLDELGIAGTASVKDVWSGKSSSPATRTVSRRLAPHACALLKLNG